MKSLWSDAEAGAFSGELGQRVYTSRLLGRDKSLVLHGGGNTSVKIEEKDLLGRPASVLQVKGGRFSRKPPGRRYPSTAETSG